MKPTHQSITELQYMRRFQARARAHTRANSGMKGQLDTRSPVSGNTVDHFQSRLSRPFIARFLDMRIRRDLNAALKKHVRPNPEYRVMGPSRTTQQACDQDDKVTTRK